MGLLAAASAIMLPHARRLPVASMTAGGVVAAASQLLQQRPLSSNPYPPPDTSRSAACTAAGSATYHGDACSLHLCLHCSDHIHIHASAAA